MSVCRNSCQLQACTSRDLSTDKAKNLLWEVLGRCLGIDKSSGKSIIAKKHRFDFIKVFTSYTMNIKCACLGQISLMWSCTWEGRAREGPIAPSTCGLAPKIPPIESPPRRNGILSIFSLSAFALLAFSAPLNRLKIFKKTFIEKNTVFPQK